VRGPGAPVVGPHSGSRGRVPHPLHAVDPTTGRRLNDPGRVTCDPLQQSRPTDSFPGPIAHRRGPGCWAESFGEEERTEVMGYVLTPIAVDLDQVSNVIGSKNKRLISALVKKFGDNFDQFDEMAADFADDDDESLTMRDALTHLVMGEECNDELGFMYGYALEFICEHFGECLPNEEWSAMPSGAAYAEKVDKALKAAGVGEKVLRMSRLMYRGAPVSLP